MKKFNLVFQDGSSGGHLQFQIKMIKAISDLQIARILPTKFPVNWPLRSREEVQNRFSRWPPLQPSWIYNQNDFSFFLSASHLDTSYQVSCQVAFLVQKRKLKIDFHGGHLEFPIRMIQLILIS